ncbi:MAG: helix-turn-helix transcriptional regulator [Anaerolineae bacterium]|nr:helix-turn-helix transcriptional regulator [Anaerolineae bacterium]MCB0225161.1 helix-turn-helix transcriptional regulator [Anaerolineae bacterium]MCB9106637.1 helix-turn-helix transcriptional regulator [Anaerolineales bacterium]
MIRSPLTIEYALLGLLYHQARHGYEIYQELLNEDGLGLVWRLKQSQLYALLAKLEQQGYMDATLEPQEGRPPRKMLQLTPAGRDAFLSWLRTPVPQGRKMRLEFMAKFYFARQIEPSSAATLIDKQRIICQDWLASLQTQANTLSTESSFEWLVYQFRIGQVEAMNTWLDICERTLVTAVL